MKKLQLDPFYANCVKKDGLQRQQHKKCMKSRGTVNKHVAQN